MSLAPSNVVLRSEAIGGGDPAKLLWSEPPRAYHRGISSPGHADPTMCIRHVRAGADEPTNKRPAYETTDPQQEALPYQQHRAPGEDAEYDRGRESKLMRLTPPFPAEQQQQLQQQAGGSAPAPWASYSQQQAPQQPHFQQEQPLMEDPEPLASGGAQDNPRLKRNKPVKWSAEEDRRLREAVVRFSEARWKDIASMVETRNHVQCLQRWKKVLKPGLVKGQWSAEEDDRLVELVNKGFRNWGQVASFMDGRTSKQCRERWCHHLDPAVRKGGYTTEEDELIIFLQGEVGNRWADIAKRLTGRTENAVKIRWKALNRRQRDARNKAAAAAASASIVHRPLSRHSSAGGSAGGPAAGAGTGGHLSSSSLSDTGGGAMGARERMAGGGAGMQQHQQQHQQQYQQRPRGVARTSSTSSSSSSSSSSLSPNLGVPSTGLGKPRGGAGGGLRAAIDTGAGAAAAAAAATAARSGGMGPGPGPSGLWPLAARGGGPYYSEPGPWTAPVQDEGRRSLQNPAANPVAAYAGAAAAGANNSARVSAAKNGHQKQAVGVDPAPPASLRRIERPMGLAAGAGAGFTGAGASLPQGSTSGAAAGGGSPAAASPAKVETVVVARVSPPRFSAAHDEDAARSATKMDPTADGGLHRLCAAVRNVEAVSAVTPGTPSERAEPQDGGAGGGVPPAKQSNGGEAPPPSSRSLQDGDGLPMTSAAAARDGPTRKSQLQHHHHDQQQPASPPATAARSRQDVRV